MKAEKNYLEIDVYSATQERLKFIFEHFSNIYLSFSAGKDSSVTLQLFIEIAKKLNRLPVKVLLIDLEAQYKATINHAEELMNQPGIVEPYWICLPLTLRNAVSVFEPQWICWDEANRDKWVREMPTFKGVINLQNMPLEWQDWFYKGMEFEEFIIKFGIWMRNRANPESKERIETACIVCIRADESLHRFLAVKKQTDERKYQDRINWSTEVRKNLYNFYPIYDWKTQDIWTAVGKFNLKYNKIYDLMYMTGRSIHEQRICQPYGQDQRKGLDLFRKIEPETWFKVVNRVAGANFGNIYRESKLLGNGKIIKPNHLTWKQYAEFLLETIPKYQAHIFRERIDQFLQYWQDVEGLPRENVPDAQPPKSDSLWFKNDGTKFSKMASWERIVKTILKNDIICKNLSYGGVVGGYPRYMQLKEMYGE